MSAEAHRYYEIWKSRKDGWMSDTPAALIRPGKRDVQMLICGSECPYHRFQRVACR